MRVQYTLSDATVTAIRLRAESLNIHPSRLVEEYLTAAIRSNAAVTLTPQSRVAASALATDSLPVPVPMSDEDRATLEEELFESP